MAAAVVNLTLLASLHGLFWPLLLAMAAALIGAGRLGGSLAVNSAADHPTERWPSPSGHPLLLGFWLPGSRPDF